MAFFLGNRDLWCQEIPLPPAPIPNYRNIGFINYGVPGAFMLYGLARWEWGKTHGFRFRDEGWFEQNTYAGGADKISHLYFSYLVDRISYNFYIKNGLSNDDSLKHSVYLSSFIGLLIELGDGFSHYGFSSTDLISDLVGVGLGHLLNRSAVLDELIGLQFSFARESSPTEYKKENYYNQVADYNNQKYLLNFRFAGVPTLKDWVGTRYINLDLGYYTRGYGSFRSAQIPPTRSTFVGVSLNFSQLLKDLYPRSDFAFYTASFFKYYQLPYISNEIN